MNAKLLKMLPIGPPDDMASDVLRIGVTMIVSLAVTSLLKMAWEKSTGDAAPTNPSKPGVTWRDALIWGILSGALSGMIKVAARRGTDLSRE